MAAIRFPFSETGSSFIAAVTGRYISRILCMQVDFHLLKRVPPLKPAALSDIIETHHPYLFCLTET